VRLQQPTHVHGVVEKDTIASILSDSPN